ncbi:MAG: GNAT family N-acetyltransferase [Theionarchaea archaeon]|nr:GNAT family N-acetyltransferase [Theionarchaea archaeon]
MLEGPVINVRVMEREELPLITKWGNDPKFGGEFEPIGQNSLHEMEKWYNNLRPGEKWFIIEKKDGTKIGQIIHSPVRHCLQIGFTIVPEERGKGYCTEAVKIMVDYIFMSRDILRVEALTNPENTASRKILENAGFTKEGVVRKSIFARGKWHDGVLYSILREEWKEPKILKD